MTVTEREWCRTQIELKRAPAKNLPEGWIAFYTPTKSKCLSHLPIRPGIFYYNVFERRSQWRHPSRAKAAAIIHRDDEDEDRDRDDDDRDDRDRDDEDRDRDEDEFVSGKHLFSRALGHDE
jgi:hypothetical protein